MALTGNPDTGTSGTHMTPGSQVLDYAQDGAAQEQEAPGKAGPGPARATVPRRLPRRWWPARTGPPGGR